jgi:uncharacterized protein (TIGR02117 family)
MKSLKIFFRILLASLFMLVSYLIVALVLTYIPVNTRSVVHQESSLVYLSTNGVHLSLIMPKSEMSAELLSGLRQVEYANYLSFGWGDRDFYLNTPTWSDLTFKNAFRALFLPTSTLIHLSRYNAVHSDWVAIHINQQQINQLNEYILGAFYLDTLSNKVWLPDEGYTANDDFYEATGTYSCFKTSNSWVNSALQESNIKSCLWTPFDFRLLSLHR